ncbi:MAG: hypothetical protein IJ411_03810 [Oscillospiraceae bacterium]|nr:hypothetical protein [Oscillospiraceae bacterium]
MKNFVAFLLAAALMLSMAACSEESSSAENNSGTQQSVEASTEEESKEKEENSEEVTEEEAENSEESAVDYSGDLSDWMYQPETEDETTLALMEIDACEYGTAGASLKQTSAAVQVWKLSQSEDITEALNAYLEGMDATQKDYFSFQWQMAVNEAEQLLTAEDAAARLEESGHGDLDLSQFSVDGLKELHETVTTALTDHGVVDAWKTHSDLEPFTNWNLDSFKGEVVTGIL